MLLLVPAAFDAAELHLLSCCAFHQRGCCDAWVSFMCLFLFLFVCFLRVGVWSQVYLTIVGERAGCFCGCLQRFMDRMCSGCVWCVSMRLVPLSRVVSVLHAGMWAWRPHHSIIMSYP